MNQFLGFLSLMVMSALAWSIDPVIGKMVAMVALFIAALIFFITGLEK